jgi:hypothetical protein
MGAVLLLMFLPVVASLGFILMTVQSEGSDSGLLAGAAFFVLCWFLVIGAMRMAKEWDEGKPER